MVKEIPVNFKLDSTLYGKAKERAAAEDRSFAGLARHAIRIYVETPRAKKAVVLDKR